MGSRNGLPFTLYSFAYNLYFQLVSYKTVEIRSEDETRQLQIDRSHMKLSIELIIAHYHKYVQSSLFYSIIHV